MKGQSLEVTHSTHVPATGSHTGVAPAHAPPAPHGVTFGAPAPEGPTPLEPPETSEELAPDAETPPDADIAPPEPPPSGSPPIDATLPPASAVLGSRSKTSLPEHAVRNSDAASAATRPSGRENAKLLGRIGPLLHRLDSVARTCHRMRSNRTPTVDGSANFVSHVPSAFVSIDVEATDSRTPAAVAALVTACNQAFPLGTCRLRHAAVGTPERTVTIEWSGPDDRVARVELSRAPTSPPESTRTLEFQPTDSVVERWRAAGYVAGTLAYESVAAEEHIPLKTSGFGSQAGRATTPVPAPRAPTPTLGSPPTTWADLAFTAGPAFHTWRTGGALRAARTLTGPWFVTLAGRYTRESTAAGGAQLTLEWFTPSFGLGWRGRVHPLELGLRIEGAYELTRASARDDLGTGTAWRWTPGLIAGLDFALQLSNWSALVLGGEFGWNGRPVEIVVHDATAGHLNRVSGTVSVGVRAMFR
jgi:hypothetical protein